MLFLVAALLMLGLVLGAVAHTSLAVGATAAVVIAVWLLVFAVRERRRAR